MLTTEVSSLIPMMLEIRKGPGAAPLVVVRVVAVVEAVETAADTAAAAKPLCDSCSCWWWLVAACRRCWAAEATSATVVTTLNGYA